LVTIPAKIQKNPVEKKKDQKATKTEEKERVYALPTRATTKKRGS